jgi:hypothetical protein
MHPILYPDNRSIRIRDAPDDKPSVCLQNEWLTRLPLMRHTSLKAKIFCNTLLETKALPTTFRKRNISKTFEARTENTL